MQHPCDENKQFNFLVFLIHSSADVASPRPREEVARVVMSCTQGHPVCIPFSTSIPLFYNS